MKLYPEMKFLVGYLFIAVLTFGHAYKHFDQSCTEQQRSKGVCMQGEAAIFSSLFWPFYISYTLWN